VRVFEQTPVLGEVGAGITLSGGAGRALSTLGLGEKTLAASLPVPDIGFLHFRTAALLAGTMQGGLPSDRGWLTPRHIHRADLHALLAAEVSRADPHAIATGKRLSGLEQAGQSVRLQFADGSLVEAPLVIGADGIRSVVRSRLFDASPPRFAGQIAYRCLIPAIQAEPFLGGVDALVYVGAGRILNRYRIRQRSLVNVVGIARSDRWEAEGWSTLCERAEFVQQFDDFHPDVRELIARAAPDSLIKWGLFQHSELPRWSVGRVVLVGDAAHPVLPFLGLGAALAIEDGIVLARALMQAKDAPGAFAAYESARHARVELVRVASIRQGEIIQAADPDRGGLEAAPSQNTALYDYDPLDAPLAL
jgi:salicylate hydroxylase